MLTIVTAGLAAQVGTQVSEPIKASIIFVTV